MDDSLVFSIIINNYNYARFLAKAIDSALDQTYSNTEIIVVDDGSTDNSREIISSYGDRIIPVFQPNGKQASALNNGFLKSKGKIVAFLDSDDYLFPNAVEKIIACWNPELSKVHYRLTVVDTAGQPLGYSMPQGASPLAHGNVLQILLQNGGYVSTPTSGNALSRAVLEKVLPIPDEYKLTADDYLCYKIPFFGEVASVEEPLGAYRIHDSNQWALTTVSGAKFQRFVRHDLQNFQLLTQMAQQQGHSVPEDLERRSIGRVWSRLISIRLDPQAHPVDSDYPAQLVFWGFQSLWIYSEFNLPKRLIYSLWFLWVGFLPLPLAEPVITWLYAPHLRPKWISKTIVKIRELAK